MPEANGGAVVDEETELQLAQTEPETLLTVQALLDRARAGDDAVLPELRALLDENPSLWREVGDMAHQAEQIWIELVAGPDLLARESLIRQLAELRAEIIGSDPTPLEKLLGERIVINYLIAWHADGMFAAKRDLSLRWAKFASERQGRSQRQLIQAIGALATLRRLTGVEVLTPVSHSEAAPESWRLRFCGCFHDA